MVPWKEKILFQVKDSFSATAYECVTSMSEIRLVPGSSNYPGSEGSGTAF